MGVDVLGLDGLELVVEGSVVIPVAVADVRLEIARLLAGVVGEADGRDRPDSAAGCSSGDRSRSASQSSSEEDSMQEWRRPGKDRYGLMML